MTKRVAHQRTRGCHIIGGIFFQAVQCRKISLTIHKKTSPYEKFKICKENVKKTKNEFV
jgi:hypothetical protein